MMFKSFFPRILAMLLAVPLVAGGAKESGEITKLVIATNATWPPIEFLNPEKEIVGLNPDMMREISRVTGVEIELRNTAWDGIFAGLANGNYDAVSSSVTITPEREKVMDFSTPYTQAGQVLITRKENTTVQTVEDLQGQAAGAQIGTTGAFALAEHPQIKVKTYNDIGLAVEDLANGNLVAVALDYPVAADYVLANENYRRRLKIATAPFTDEYYGVAVKKGNQAVLDIINRGLRELEESGKMDQIRAKWLGS